MNIFFTAKKLVSVLRASNLVSQRTQKLRTPE